MSAIEEYRATQKSIRQITSKLGELNSLEKNHPLRGTALEWAPIKQDFEKRRLSLKKHLTKQEAKRATLNAALNQSPLTKASLAHVIDHITEIEASFTEESAGDAWEKLSAFLDWLEHEERRINVEEQVAKLEGVAA